MLSLIICTIPVAGPIDFASMPLANLPETARVYRIILDSTWWEREGGQHFDCWSRDDAYRTVLFRPGIDVSERTNLIVRALPVLVAHREYVELRLVDAELVGP